MLKFTKQQITDADTAIQTLEQQIQELTQQVVNKQAEKKTLMDLDKKVGAGLNKAQFNMIKVLEMVREQAPDSLDLVVEEIKASVNEWVADFLAEQGEVKAEPEAEVQVDETMDLFGELPDPDPEPTSVLGVGAVPDPVPDPENEKELADALNY